MKLKDDAYYANIITRVIQTITLAIFGLDFVLIAILLA